MKYFMLFKAEHDGDARNDVVDLGTEITSAYDIECVEAFLSDEWFGDDREVMLLNFLKL